MRRGREEDPFLAVNGALFMTVGMTPKPSQTFVMAKDIALKHFVQHLLFTPRSCVWARERFGQVF